MLIFSACAISICPALSLLLIVALQSSSRYCEPEGEVGTRSSHISCRPAIQLKWKSAIQEDSNTPDKERCLAIENALLQNLERMLLSKLLAGTVEAQQSLTLSGSDMPPVDKGILVAVGSVEIINQRAPAEQTPNRADCWAGQSADHLYITSAGSLLREVISAYSC